MQNFFGSVDQNWLIQFLEHRIGDTRIIRLIRKWLRAGILEDGVLTVDDRGTGQESVISPLLTNIYLHYTGSSLSRMGSTHAEVECLGALVGQALPCLWGEFGLTVSGADGVCS